MSLNEANELKITVEMLRQMMNMSPVPKKECLYNRCAVSADGWRLSKWRVLGSRTASPAHLVITSSCCYFILDFKGPVLCKIQFTSLFNNNVCL